MIKAPASDLAGFVRSLADNYAYLEPHGSEAKSVLVPIANGSEEMEAVITIDVLRRAGCNVTVASVESGLEVTASRSVKLVADRHIKDCAGETFDCIALPGGMPGAERLAGSVELAEMLKQQSAAGRLTSAICAAPAVVLEPLDILAGKKATCHPGFVDKLSEQSDVEKRVVIDGHVVTSRGPGTAFEFALTLTKQLCGEDKAKEVAGPMVMYPHTI